MNDNNCCVFKKIINIDKSLADLSGIKRKDTNKVRKKKEK